MRGPGRHPPRRRREHHLAHVERPEHQAPDPAQLDRDTGARNFNGASRNEMATTIPSQTKMAATARPDQWFTAAPPPTGAAAPAPLTGHSRPPGQRRIVRRHDGRGRRPHTAAIKVPASQTPQGDRHGSSPADVGIAVALAATVCLPGAPPRSRPTPPRPPPVDPRPPASPPRPASAEAGPATSATTAPRIEK